MNVAGFVVFSDPHLTESENLGLALIDLALGYDTLGATLLFGDANGATRLNRNLLSQSMVSRMLA